MTPLFHHRRPGVTLVELLIFLAILSVVALVMIPLLFASTENRLLQETISIVEHNGSQIMQALGSNIRQSERVIDPVRGFNGTKTVLMLQTATNETNPTIFGVSTGALILVQRDTRQSISSSQVSVQNFSVRNTSTSGTGQSVLVSFTLTRTIRLNAPRTYNKKFEALFTLYPKTVETGNSCTTLTNPPMTNSPMVPGCIGTSQYSWPILQDTTCLLRSTPMTCL